MTAQDPITAEAEAFVDLHRQRCGTTLDYAPASFAVVDALLDELHRRRVRPAKARALVNGAACYVGEVLRRQFGGRWVEAPAVPPRRRTLVDRLLARRDAAPPDPMLHLDGLVLSPVERVRQRIAHGEQDSLTGYYRGIERVLLPEWNGPPG